MEAPRIVRIDCDTAGATVRYTRDGTDPTSDSPVYVSPINLDSTTTLSAGAWREGWSTGATASVTYSIVPRSSIGQLRNLPEDTLVYVDSAVVTAENIAAGSIFVGSLDRSSGVKLLTGEIVARGDRLKFSGRTGRVDGEYLVHGVAFHEIGSGAELRPLGLTTRAIGNDPTQFLNYIGLNTTGLLVRLTGRVTGVSSIERFIYIDDGRGYRDGVGPVPGIRVRLAPGVTLPAMDDFVAVTGISRVEKHTLTTWGDVNGDWYPAGTTVYVPTVWIRDANDLQVL